MAIKAVAELARKTGVAEKDVETVLRALGFNDLSTQGKNLVSGETIESIGADGLRLSARLGDMLIAR